MYRYLIPLLIFLSPVSASAASIYLDPDKGTYGPGDTFILNIRLNTDGDCINAANIVLSYPADSMRAVDFGKGGSILSLWVTEPVIDTQKGTVTFAGGIPGGYCGRIQGDPALTNSLGKVVFTVTNAGARNAVIRVVGDTAVYLNDGQGTKVAPGVRNAAITLTTEARQSENPWLAEVGADTVPPESFDVQVESTRSVFGGRYYAIFSTVDKQSGLDHYEMVINGSWQKVTSPKVVDDHVVESGLQVRAIDKAGNVRVGTFVQSSVPPRESNIPEYASLSLILLLLALVLVARHYLNKRKSTETVDLRS